MSGRITEADLKSLYERAASGEAVPELAEPAAVESREITDADFIANGFTDRFKLIRYILENAPDVGELVALGQLFIEAENIVDRWEIAKQIGDRIVPFIDKFPMPESGAAFSQSAIFEPTENAEQVTAELNALAESKGIGLEVVRQFVSVVLPIIAELLLKKYGG